VEDASLHERLLQLLAEELEEHAQAMNADLLALEAEPADPERLRSLFRTAHTLKGAARAAGVSTLESACHSLEDHLAEIRDQARPIASAEIETLYRAADGLLEASRLIRAGDGVDESVFPDLNSGRRGAGAPEPAIPQPTPSPSVEERTPSAPAQSTIPVPETRTLRVAPERLDDLLASAAEMLRLARRADAQRQEIEALVDFAGRWNSVWRRSLPRLNPALDRGGASEAEREAISTFGENLRSLAEQARSLAQRATADALQLARTAEEITTDIRLLRMRPVRELTDTLPRTVRDLAASAGKEVRLEFEGTEVEVDRMVLDALREALIPIIRNSIDHGIESPEERQRLGKPREAELRITAELHADRVLVVVTDDGRGIDANLLRRKYSAAGYALPPDDRSLAEALLGGGISSRTRASVISGRGVGLDIVRAAMARVRGTVQLDWEPNTGTTVTLEFPPSLANLRALLVSLGSQVFALPTSSVRRVVRLSVEKLGTVEGRAVLPDADGPIPVVPLARVLGPPLVERPLAGSMRAVVMGGNGTQVAFVVDEVLAEEELILRPIPIGSRSLQLIAGAAILGHGGVAPVVDAHALLKAVAGVAPATLPKQQPAGAGKERSILVVDDSLTTRTLEQSVLEAAGFAVVTASDGLDALRVLQAQPVDLVVSDVEMPRLDGFRLCESIRASDRFRPIPVILVTARERPEDRKRGMEAGADAYLLKSSFDQEQLLATIEQLLGE
jgi:two-component system, chemotaxis family, sensor kinase CheA